MVQALIEALTHPYVVAMFAFVNSLEPQPNVRKAFSQAAQAKREWEENYTSKKKDPVQ